MCLPGCAKNQCLCFSDQRFPLSVFILSPRPVGRLHDVQVGGLAVEETIKGMDELLAVGALTFQHHVNKPEEQNTATKRILRDGQSLFWES